MEGKIPRYSIIPSLALRDSRLSARDITVLCALGEFTNGWGECRPSISKLAAILSTSQQAVQESLHRLETCGYITSGQVSGLYHINLDHAPDDKHIRGAE